MADDPQEDVQSPDGGGINVVAFSTCTSFGFAIGMFTDDLVFGTGIGAGLGLLLGLLLGGEKSPEETEG